MPSLRFELRTSKAASYPYYWLIVATSGSTTLATSQRYERKADAEASLNLVYYESHEATYVDYT